MFGATVTVSATAAVVSVAEVPLQLLLEQIRLQFVLKRLLCHVH